MRLNRRDGLFILGAAMLAVFLAGLHHWLGRADRIAAEAARLNLLSVRDQILLYEFRTGQLPERLQQLVPQQLRRDQIGTPSQPLFRYDRAGRWIEESSGPRIKGIVVYHLAPRGIDLPQPERSPVRVTPRVAQNSRPPVANVERPRLPPTEPSVVIGQRQRPAAETPVENPPPAASVEPPEPELHIGARDLTAMFQPPVGPELRPPPAGCLVFEAEHFSESNYGWEVQADSAAAGGAYLHCKEGIGNIHGQTTFQVGNFYDRHSKTDQTFLRFHFHLPASSRYYVYGRMWTTDTHCSNYVAASFDSGGPRVGGMGNRTPFRWLWSEMKDNPVTLSAGDHFLHLFIHEDGIKIDQFIFSPRPLSGGEAYQANFTIGAGTDWLARNPAAQIAFDYKNMTFTENMPPEANLVLRRLRPSTERMIIHAVLRGAAADGKDVELCHGQVDLAKCGELNFLPLSFEGIDLKSLPCREYLLHATLTGKAGVISEIEVPLQKPFAWEVFGPGKFLSIDKRGPLDADGEPREGDQRKWTAFAEKNWQLFGVMDFGLYSSGNSLHPPQQTCIYARTTINVPETADYLFKIQSDDQMLLWLDGDEIFRFNRTQPVTRTAERLTVRLTKGQHRLRMRVNQFEGRWQAYLRIRTKDDDISSVTGSE